MMLKVALRNEVLEQSANPQGLDSRSFHIIALRMPTVYNFTRD